MNAPTYNFAYLDEQTKRMIRRAILKATPRPEAFLGSPYNAGLVAPRPAPCRMKGGPPHARAVFLGPSWRAVRLKRLQ